MEIGSLLPDSIVLMTKLCCLPGGYSLLFIVYCFCFLSFFFFLVVSHFCFSCCTHHWKDAFFWTTDCRSFRRGGVARAEAPAVAFLHIGSRSCGFSPVNGIGRCKIARRPSWTPWSQDKLLPWTCGCSRSDSLFSSRPSVSQNQFESSQRTRIPRRKRGSRFNNRSALLSLSCHFALSALCRSWPLPAASKITPRHFLSASSHTAPALPCSVSTAFGSPSTYFGLWRFELSLTFAENGVCIFVSHSPCCFWMFSSRKRGIC